jgi:hypothetical protein
MPTLDRKYRETSPSDGTYPFSQQDGIQHIIKLLGPFLTNNELFRKSFKEILSQKIGGLKDCTEKIAKIPFSVQDMINAIYAAMKSIDFHDKALIQRAKPYVGNKSKLPTVNETGIGLSCYDLVFSLDTIARNIAFWHKDGVWSDACTFVWIAEDPIGVGSGTTVSTRPSAPKGYYNRDESIEADYTLETEMLYYINVSEPGGFLHSLAPLYKLAQLRNRVIITLDIMQTHITPQTYNWKLWEKTEVAKGITFIDLSYKPPLPNVLWKDNRTLVAYFETNKREDKNKYTIEWTEALQQELDALDKRREYCIAVWENHNLYYYRPEQTQRNEPDKVDALRQSFPGESTVSLTQAVRGGDEGRNSLLLKDLKEREKKVLFKL